MLICLCLNGSVVGVHECFVVPPSHSSRLCGAHWQDIKLQDAHNHNIGVTVHGDLAEEHVEVPGLCVFHPAVVG